jgi:hypothetical protein
MPIRRRSATPVPQRAARRPGRTLPLSPPLLRGPGLYLWWAIRRDAAPGERPSPANGAGGGRASARRRPRRYSLAHAKFRLSRLEPALFAASATSPGATRTNLRPATWRRWPRLAGAMAGVQRRPGWRFPSDPLPLSQGARTALGPPARGTLERHHHPARIGARRRYRPSPPRPPALADALSRQPRRAPRRRGLDSGLSFGPPSINGRFALQCSITPSSRRFITARPGPPSTACPTPCAAWATAPRCSPPATSTWTTARSGSSACTTACGAIPRRASATARSSATPRRGSARWAAGAVPRLAHLGEQPPSVPLARAGPRRRRPRPCPPAHPQHRALHRRRASAS